MNKFINLGMLLVVAVLVGCQEQKDEQMLNDAREKCIELNQRFNDLNMTAMVGYLNGNTDWRLVGNTLQAMTTQIIDINKSLGIDCTKYDEEGNPILVEHENGEKYPLEIIPNELQLMK